MIKCRVFPRGSWLHPWINILLAIILIFGMYPSIVGEVLAQTEKVTPDQFKHGPADHIVISPDDATITAGQSQSYTATAYDLEGNDWDVTADTTFSIDPDAGGSWTSNTYTSEFVSTWTVTGTYDSHTDDATLTVEQVSQGPADHIVISPDDATITADQSQSYTATAYDLEGNDWDVTADTSFSIDADAGGSWSDNTYTSEFAGTWTVTATYDSHTDDATLTVEHKDQRQPPVPSPKGATVLVSPGEEVEITSPSGKVILRIPRGAVSAPVEVELAEYTPWGSTGMRMVSLFELNARLPGSGKKVSQFNKNLEISIHHDPGELRGLDLDTLRLYYLDEKSQQWLPVSTSKYDCQQMVLTATSTHFSYYSEQADPIINGPGRVMAAQADMHSGAAIFNYPIELPPGPGGFQPKLDLVYNSGVVDEMKNKRSMGSWVGIGWTLHLGRISYDLTDELYYLELNDASYQLASSDGTNYRTNPDQYFKITRSENTWELWDREGVYYRFGGTTDSKQYVESGNDYYRWDLSLMRDTNGNEASISYVRDIHNGSVRSAYPEYLTYNNVEVHFNSSWDGYDHQRLRKDNPESTDDNDAPKVMENRKLDSIEIRVSDALIRKYTFAYDTTDRVYSDDYGGIYYSGKHSLTSITQVGADDTSQLPPMTFTYQDLETYRHGSQDEDEYSGNPGNPASFTWPHLTEVNSGYGGTISFSYTQIPDTTANSIWTREAVTTRTINGGIGTSQSYTYTYTGNPQYLGLGWDQKYRGFTEVKETDSAGNYVKHWFYTTGEVDGKDAERLSGEEYKTQWFNSSDVLLRERVNDWAWHLTSQTYDFLSSWSSSGTGDEIVNDGEGITVSSDGYVYVTDFENDRVRKFGEYGNFILKWGSDDGTGDGQFKDPEGIAVSGDGYVYVVDTENYRVQKFDADGNFILNWGSEGTGDGQFKYTHGIAISNDGYVYVTDYLRSFMGSVTYSRVQKFDADGNFILNWGSYGTGDGQFIEPVGVAVSSDGYVYVTDYYHNRVQKFDADGNFILKWGSCGEGEGQFRNPRGIAVSSDGYVYVTDALLGLLGSVKYSRVQKFDADGNFILKWDGFRNYIRDVAVSTNCMYVMVNNVGVSELMYNWAVRLSGVNETIGSKTSRTRYEYDNYGNVITTYLDGDLDTNDDDATIHRVFHPNDTANILSMPARERVYATITDDVGGANLEKETLYYYDGNDLTTPPTQGNLTRLEQKKDESASVSSYYTYDTYGNMLTSQDPNGSTTTWTYETTHHTYPESKTYPVSGLSESYTYDVGTFNLLSLTDFNDQTTTYQYDTFKRLLKVIKPGDSESSPSVEYQYNDWGTLNQQHLKTLTKVADGDYLWQSQYFDGLGRVLQVHARGETGHTIISTTTAYNNIGLVDKNYVSQGLDSPQVNGYEVPEAGWKYTSYEYDGLGRVTTQTNADGTSISHDYSTAWQELVTNERGLKKRYYYDAFNRLIQIEELDDSHQVYATTEYSYNILSNLTQVVDNSSNTITISYDWLSRKTAMTDPDMGSWSYGYDDNSNLVSQTDAKGQTVNFTYDALNRLTGKSYPEGSGMTDVTYTYDSTDGDNYGKGQRTGMTDALGATSYKYDDRGRLIEETRTIDSVDYTTQFAYDGADRVTSSTYPTGETVTQEYNGRGLPYSLSGSVAGDLVTSTLYNHLGQVNEIYLGNGLRTMFGYWDVGTIYDTTGGYYGRLWRVQTSKAPWNDLVVQDEKYTWDAAGNLTQREDILAVETETFTYDFLDRLTSAAGPYSESYTYNEIGNITSKNGISYSYGSKPHAVTAVGSTSYTYDANGNMTARGSQILTWDVENRPVSITDGANTSTFIYDGNGNRVKKTEGGETILYVNKYYEKNLTTEEVTTYYFHGAKLVAMCQGTELSYIHQDHLTSTAVMTDSSGNELGTIKYFPFGATRSGSVPTDKKFTGQRLDETGLYYYGARYYDANIGRFISADSVITDFTNPQAFNRYSYCLNNPLKYTDPTGHGFWGDLWNEIVEVVSDVVDAVVNTVQPVVETVKGWFDSTTGNGQQAPAPSPEPELPIQPTDVTIDVYEPFTLVPPGYGTVTGSISSEWDDYDVTVTVETTTTIIAPETSSGFASAKVKIDGKSYKIKLEPPDYPVWASRGTYEEGSKTIMNIPPEAQVTVDLSVGAWTNTWDPSSSPYHWVLPPGWNYVLWEGRD